MRQEQHPGQHNSEDERTETKPGKLSVLLAFLKAKVWIGLGSSPSKKAAAISEQVIAHGSSAAIVRSPKDTTELSQSSVAEREKAALAEVKRQVAVFFEALVQKMTEQIAVQLGEDDLLEKIKKCAAAYTPGKTLNESFTSQRAKECLTQNRFFTFKGRMESGLNLKYTYDFDLRLLTIDVEDEKGEVNFEITNLDEMDRLSIKLSMGYAGSEQMEHIKYNFFNLVKNEVAIQRFNKKMTTNANYAVIDEKTIGFKDKQVIIVEQGQGVHFKIEYPSLQVIHAYGLSSSPQISRVIEGGIEQIKVAFPMSVGDPELTLPTQVSIETIFEYIRMLVMRKRDTGKVTSTRAPHQLT